MNPAGTCTPVSAATSRAARATGRQFAQTASAVVAWTSGPYCTRPVTPAGASPTDVSPHCGHTFACTWHSVTSGGGGGAASNTCRFCIPATGTSARPCPQQPHAAGPHSTVLSGLPDWLSAEDCAPGCLPGSRPERPRSDRSSGFFWYGLPEEDGFDDVDESPPGFRRNSSTCAASASIRASRTASCAAASSSRSAAARRSRAFTASSSATRARSHPESDGGTGGASGTSRTPSEPGIHDQRDMPGKLTEDQKPGSPRPA